jgi:ABC-type nitrate/sulfonate/bicarbonate transport system ATPase subunit
VFQDDALLSHRDAVGNVLLPSLPKATSADIARAVSCLQLWGLGGSEGKFPHELSGGMRKRLAMARAWFYRPNVLLLDEPFANLDAAARLELWDRFFEIRSALAIPTLIVTHYPAEIERFDVALRSWESLFTGSS